LKIRDKLENSSMDNQVLEHIEDRVAEMIRAAAPVESDIVDRIQLLFENKMLNKEELENILEERLADIEQTVGSAGGTRPGTMQDGPAPSRGNTGSQSFGDTRHDLGTRGSDKLKSRQRERTSHSNYGKDMQSLSSKADRRELLNAIESVEKQVPGAQDRLATALAARAHCYQTLRCLSCDQTASPPPTGMTNMTHSSGPTAMIPKGAKRTERLVNIRSLLEQQERAGTTDNNHSRRNLSKSPSSFLHLVPRTNTAGGPGIVGVNTPRGAITLKHAGLDMIPQSEMRNTSPAPDDLVDMNMSLGLHVRSLPQLQPEKQWSPEVARELRKGFNC